MSASMLPTFGPEYPIPLQDALNHASRVVAALRGRGDAIVGAAPQETVRWLDARANEVAAFAATVSAEWFVDPIASVESGQVLEEFIDAIHVGVAVLGLDPLACCSRPSGPGTEIERATSLAREAR